MEHQVSTSEQQQSAVYVRQVELSVVIPSFNTAHLIDQQLEALAAQQFDRAWEVIVADNGSTDDTAEVVARYSERLPGLRIVDAADHRGASHARNVGARAAAGDYILFVDADDVVAPGFVEAMAAALQQHDFVAPRLEAQALNSHWAARLGQHPQYNGLSRYYNPPYLPYAGGCGLGISRSLFLSLGGFDTGAPSLEDTEFCFRAQLAGARLTFVPEAMIHVRNRASLKGMLRQSRAWGGAEVRLTHRYRGRTSLAGALALWARYLARWLKLAVRLACARSRVDAVRIAQEAARQIGIFETALSMRVAPI